MPPSLAAASFAGLDTRSASILRELVEVYVQTGEPVGSRTLSRRLPLGLSPASVRNVMSDLEEAGFLYAPHTSAGRLPTDRGLRLFVDGLLEFGDLGEEERDAIAARCAASRWSARCRRRSARHGRIRFGEHAKPLHIGQTILRRPMHQTHRRAARIDFGVGDVEVDHAVANALAARIQNRDFEFVSAIAARKRHAI